jgi:hypothetical protein
MWNCSNQEASNMELSRASIEEIVEELAKRPIEFSLIVRTEAEQNDDESEAEEYSVYGSEAVQGEPTLPQAVRCLIGGLVVLTGLSEEFDELEEYDKSHDVARWVAVDEVLLNDLFQTSEQWPEIAGSSERPSGR